MKVTVSSTNKNKGKLLSTHKTAWDHNRLRSAPKPLPSKCLDHARYLKSSEISSLGTGNPTFGQVVTKEVVEKIPITLNGQTCLSLQLHNFVEETVVAEFLAPTIKEHINGICWSRNWPAQRVVDYTCHECKISLQLLERTCYILIQTQGIILVKECLQPYQGRTYLSNPVIQIKPLTSSIKGLNPSTWIFLPFLHRPTKSRL